MSPPLFPIPHSNTSVELIEINEPLIEISDLEITKLEIDNNDWLHTCIVNKISNDEFNIIYNDNLITNINGVNDLIDNLPNSNEIKNQFKLINKIIDMVDNIFYVTRDNYKYKCYKSTKINQPIIIKTYRNHKLVMILLKYYSYTYNNTKCLEIYSNIND